MRKNWVASAQGMLKRCACRQFRPSGRVIVGSLLLSNNDPGRFDHAGRCFVAFGAPLVRKNWVASAQGMPNRCACQQFRVASATQWPNAHRGNLLGSAGESQGDFGLRQWEDLVPKDPCVCCFDTKERAPETPKLSPIANTA